MLNKSEIEFIKENAKADTNKLLLNAPKKSIDSNINIPLCVKCIEARRKVESKIPLWYANDSLVYPFPLSVEQSSSQTTALYKQRIIKKILPENNINIADVTAGMGVDSYFLSLIAEDHYYIERNSELCNATQYNFNKLKTNNIKILNEECLVQNNALFSFLANKDLSIIYVDPARRSKTNSKVISLQDYEPNVLELKSEFFKLAPYLLIKLSPMADIKLNLKLLPETIQIHVISVNNECKELLFLLKHPNHQILEKDINIYEPQIFAINITPQVERSFSFTLSEEENAKAELTSTIGNYIFEPDKSILKCGAYKLLSQSFDLKKLASSTHLYTKDTICSNFPGKTFEVQEVRNFNKKEIKEIAKQYPNADLSARNFPLDTNGLKKLSGIKDGGVHHIFAVTVTNGDKKIIVCKNKLITSSYK